MLSHHGPLSYQSLHSSQPPTAQLSQPCPNYTPSCQLTTAAATSAAYSHNCRPNSNCLIQLPDNTTAPTANTQRQSAEPTQSTCKASSCLLVLQQQCCRPCWMVPKRGFIFLSTGRAAPTSWPHPHTVPGTHNSQAKPAVDKKGGGAE
jgi:hypothetical protein